MKQLFYIFSFISVVCSFASCSNEDNIIKYGDKQRLQNTEWIYTYPMDGLGYNLPLPTETLCFGLNELTNTHIDWKYNDKNQQAKEISKTKVGSYEYKHPNIKIVFEDDSEAEAYISPRNTIIYKNKGESYYMEFERQNKN